MSLGAWAEAYLPTKWHIDPSTTDMGRKLGALSPFGGGGDGSPYNAVWPGPRPTCMPSFILIHPSIWPQQIWAKNWGLCPLLGEGELGPHLTQCGHLYPYAKFHLDPSNRLATVHQRHRQDRRRPKDRTERQRSNRIGRTALQLTVAQKQDIENKANSGLVQRQVVVVAHGQSSLH